MVSIKGEMFYESIENLSQTPVRLAKLVPIFAGDSDIKIGPIQSVKSALDYSKSFDVRKERSLLNSRANVN